MKAQKPRKRTSDTLGLFVPQDSTASGFVKSRTESHKKGKEAPIITSRGTHTLLCRSKPKTKKDIASPATKETPRRRFCGVNQNQPRERQHDHRHRLGSSERVHSRIGHPFHTENGNDENDIVYRHNLRGEELVSSTRTDKCRLSTTRQQPTMLQWQTRATINNHSSIKSNNNNNNSSHNTTARHNEPLGAAPPRHQ